MFKKLVRCAKSRGGALFMLMAFWIVSVMVPLMAVAFDLGQIYLYKLYCTHLAQMSALSVMPHSENKYLNTKVSTPMLIASNTFTQNMRLMNGESYVESKQQTDVAIGVKKIYTKHRDRSMMTLFSSGHFSFKDAGRGCGGPNSPEGLFCEYSKDRKTFITYVRGYYKPIFLCGVIRGACTAKGVEVVGEKAQVRGMFID